MSNPDGAGRLTNSRDRLFEALADRTRREALRLVCERSPDGVAKSDLAVELTAVTSDKPPAAVSDDERRRSRIECHHRILPALIDAGLLAEREDGRLVTADRPGFDETPFTAALDAESDGTGVDADVLFDVLADSRRRTALAVLADRPRTLAVGTLARDVAARSPDTAGRVSLDRIRRVRASLVHRHLPLLDDAGFVTYDPDAASVSIERNPCARIDWLWTVLDRETVTVAPSGPSAPGMVRQ